jgi:hypothetical protein
MNTEATDWRNRAEAMRRYSLLRTLNYQQLLRYLQPSPSHRATYELQLARAERARRTANECERRAALAEHTDEDLLALATAVGVIQ